MAPWLIKDTVDIAVLDIDKGDLLVNEDRTHQPFLLCLQNHWEELVNHWHLHISTIVSGDQGLEGEATYDVNCAGIRHIGPFSSWILVQLMPYMKCDNRCMLEKSQNNGTRLPPPTGWPLGKCKHRETGTKGVILKTRFMAAYSQILASLGLG